MILDQARACLQHGEWLRGQHRRPDALRQLGLAHETFSSMGAMAFAERARTAAALTAQEERVAWRAASG